MIGDKLIIKPHHTARAIDIYELLNSRITKGYTLSIAGESGAGKSELAAETARILSGRGIKAGILQQDDYFVFPPKTNHEMRRRNIEQVGPFEVKIDFLDSNLRSFKRNESPIFKPLVDFTEDKITSELMDIDNLEVLIAEGTYTSLLNFLDFRVFIDRDYHHTFEDRKQRARDKFDPFIADVLEIEHQIISGHKSKANVVISSDFNKMALLKD